MPRHLLLNTAVEQNDFALFLERISGEVQWSDIEFRKLQQEVATLKQEKADLEILLDTTTAHFDLVLHDLTERKARETVLQQQVRTLQIEIDQAKLAHQVAEITQTDYFKALQAQIEQLQFPGD
jgi:chromosome segregation ATPase